MQKTATTLTILHATVFLLLVLIVAGAVPAAASTRDSHGIIIPSRPDVDRRSSGDSGGTAGEPISGGSSTSNVSTDVTAESNAEGNVSSASVDVTTTVNGEVVTDIHKSVNSDQNVILEGTDGTGGRDADTTVEDRGGDSSDADYVRSRGSTITRERPIASLTPFDRVAAFFERLFSYVFFA